MRNVKVSDENESIVKQEEQSEASMDGSTLSK